MSKRKQNWRPLRILFVGDEPSSRNVDSSVPFVGTPSYKRLLKWIGELDLCLSNVELINSTDFPKTVYYDAAIFLGNKSLDKYSKNGGTVIPTASLSYKLYLAPHPSPRNRKFNEPGYETKMLRELKNWLYSE